MEITQTSPDIIQNRRKELEADAAIGLMNLSGLRASADGACGIYLLKKKILFETQIEHFDLPLERLKKVFTDAQTDITSNYGYKQKNDLAFALPIIGVLLFRSSRTSTDKPDIYVTEKTLVFEYKKDNHSTDYIVFAFGQGQFDEVQQFVNATYTNMLNQVS